VTVLVARVAQALHGLRPQQPLLVTKAAKFQLVRPNMLGEVTRRNARRSGFEHNDTKASLRCFFGHPSAAGP
jgi:hypothetical protein